MIEDEVVVKIEITLTKNGGVSVNGPIQDRILCYGMLQMARDAIYEYNQNAKSQILVPKMPIAAIGGKKN